MPTHVSDPNIHSEPVAATLPHYSLEEWKAAHEQLSRCKADEELPRPLLWDLRHCLDQETLQRAIHQVWVDVSNGLFQRPEFPEVPQRTSRLTRDEWRELFTLAGPINFEVDEYGDGYGGTGCTAPSTLFRYAMHSDRDGWAWTTTLEAAAEYRDQFQIDRRPGCLWLVSDVNPKRILAHIHTKTIKSGFEDEYIFEPRLSEIVHVPNCPGDCQPHL